MGFKDRLILKAGKSLDEEYTKAISEIVKNLKFLEEHMITIQENQVEQEKYLKDILTKLK
jgi:hypothetical protein